NSTVQRKAGLGPFVEPSNLGPTIFLWIYFFNLPPRDTCHRTSILQKKKAMIIPFSFQNCSKQQLHSLTLSLPLRILILFSDYQRFVTPHQMATITAAHFVSRTTTNVSSDVKKRPDAVGLISHHGLRTVNKLQIRTQPKSIAAARVGRIVAAATDSESSSPSAKIGSEIGMDLVFISAECGPWSKTGGLGDVLGGLPPAMAARGHRVMTVCPRYDQYKDAWDTGVLVELKVGDKLETVRFFHCHKRGVDRVFVDHPLFLEKVWGKTGSKVYGPTTGIDYKDNQLRFSLLCQVAFCIHNIAYQGRFSFSDFSLLNLPDSFRSSFDFMDGYHKPVKGRKINWMKAGILESDRVITVSPYYAEELVSGEDKGVELDNILRVKTVTGIANGMDVQEWNPATDKFIDVKYDATTVMDAKPLLKEALQAECGFPVDSSIPVFGFIGRLEEQKGSDILCEAIPQLIEQNIQIIILGTGKKHMEKQIQELEKLYPDKVRGVAKFNVPLAHMITAGADFMLIPSRFEPCGLIQLHAMRYGTVPCVASTGGLVDTVKEGYTGFQMGAFNVECEAVDPDDVAKIVAAVPRVIATYGTPALKEMIQNGMAQDLSWKGPARLWEKMLLGLEAAGSEAGVEGDEIAPLAKENVATP
ncbi:Granule-bound starch synthase 1, chloroplastic/amyloplastic, partial [Linum perenne]